MITYEEAFKIANERKDIDYCVETKHAWIFSNSNEGYYEGGGHGSVCVMKKDGSAMNYLAYLWEINFKDNETIKEWKI